MYKYTEPRVIKTKGITRFATRFLKVIPSSLLGHVCTYGHVLRRFTLTFQLYHANHAGCLYVRARDCKPRKQSEILNIVLHLVLCGRLFDCILTKLMRRFTSFG